MISYHLIECVEYLYLITSELTKKNLKKNNFFGLDLVIFFCVCAHKHFLYFIKNQKYQGRYLLGLKQLSKTI